MFEDIATRLAIIETELGIPKEEDKARDALQEDIKAQEATEEACYQPSLVSIGRPNPSPILFFYMHKTQW